MSADSSRAPGAAASLLRRDWSTDWCRSAFRGTLAEGRCAACTCSLPPSRESKLVRCTRGAIYDVIIDLRPESPTYLRHFGLELQAQTGNALYIPPLMAHGFQTLADDTEVLYQMTDTHAPELVYGVRWNDPAFAIGWPVQEPITIIGRDRDYADFDPEAYAARVQRAREGLQ